MHSDDVVVKNEIEARYFETETERIVRFSAGDAEATIAQNRSGYAMLAVRYGPDDEEVERYYGLDMALDHVGEILGVSPHELPIPNSASDLGI